ncbi:hypothetical protein SP38_133 [Salmonella phage 38]|uniref:Uncharacterized protein n=1 Tax=Salmonella phage 38 TaxID=1654891 RepID=A0A0N7CDD7_9CAUD|nr:hypothetical protein SP38_133 [Salmonella phage 38]AKJ73735.1 hypothetical protein SP38_133 [Salmonella phage 38]
MFEYSADQESDRRLKKEWRTRALGLRAWLVENDHYYEDRVQNWLKYLSTNCLSILMIPGLPVNSSKQELTVII